MPALSRNGDAPGEGMSPDAWPVPTCCPRRKGGSFRCPVGRRSGRTSSSTTRRRMTMRVLSRRLPASRGRHSLSPPPAQHAASSQPTSPRPARPLAAASRPRCRPPTGRCTSARGRRAIISLSPTSTEMLYAIGAGRQVKAVDSDSDYPPQAPMTKLSGFQPNVEAIVGYKPDLVVVDDNTGGLIKSLAAFKIPVLELPGRHQALRRVRAVRRARPGHRPPRPGRAGEHEDDAVSSSRSPRPRRITRRRSPITTSLTRPTTRSPRPPSSGSCCTCSG